MSHSAISVLAAVTVLAAGCGPGPGAQEPVATEKPTTSAVFDPIVVGAVAVKVIEGIEKAYNIYNKVMGFIEHAPSLAETIEAARDEILDDLHRMKRDDLASDFQARVFDYGEIARNPMHSSTQHRLNEWLRDSSSLFWRLKTVMDGAQVGQDRTIQDAYTLAPAFNAIGAMRLSVMNGIPELNFEPLAESSREEILIALREANYRLVGAQQGIWPDHGLVEPFWGSVFWRTSKLGYSFWSCSKPGCGQIDTDPNYNPAELCDAYRGCDWTCAESIVRGDKDGECYVYGVARIKTAFTGDPVINIMRFGLARALQTLKNFWIFDPNWGWIVIKEA